MRASLAAVARTRGCTVADLAAVGPRWQSPVPYSNLCAAIQQRATELRDALAPVAEQQHIVEGPALIELARVAWRQHLRQDPPPDDELRYILDRATRRNNGQSDWNDPTLYLDESDFRRSDPTPEAAPDWLAPLTETIRHMEDRVTPTLRDRAFLWHMTFRIYEAQAPASAGSDVHHKVKKTLVEHLLRSVPNLYRSQSGTGEEPRQPYLATKRLFNLNLVRWRNGGRTVESLLTVRKGWTGRKGYRCPVCEPKMKKLAIGFRGQKAQSNVDLAVITMREHGDLCPACMAHWQGHRIAKTLRSRITPNKIQIAKAKGRRFLNSVGPTGHCDWSDTKPGDRFVIDDMTTNELSWVEVDGELFSGQVQMLAVEDEYSAYALPFHLYFGAPNAREIKKTLWSVFSTVGLPRFELVTERGAAVLILGVVGCRLG